MKQTASVKAALVITDASCLIVLDKIGHLHLLPMLFSEVVTTPKIIVEWQRRTRMDAGNCCSQ